MAAARPADFTLLEQLLSEQRSAWKEGRTTWVEQLVADKNARLEDSELLELIRAEIRLRTENGHELSEEEYVRRFPQFSFLLSAMFSKLRQTSDPHATSVPNDSPQQSTSPKRSQTANEAYRNLLFGLVALQNGVVSREQLVMAFSVWLLDKQRLLESILLEQQVLTPDRCDHLKELFDAHMRLHEADPVQSVAQFDAVQSACQILRRLNDPELQASLQSVILDQPLDDPDKTRIASDVPQPQAPLQRFQIKRFLAQGGLGKVSVALDTELNREVAYKQILDKHQGNRVVRDHFVLEATITGGLEHPGIVPIYSLGEDSNGDTFYAMQLIHNDSMRHAVDQFHKPERRSTTSPTELQRELRKLLGQFVSVCNTVQFAHSRGVLHRDLKPDNILIGTYGETLVVDWGLAKVIGKKNQETADTSFHPASPLPNAHLTPRDLGSGTLGYMSPEEAAGNWDGIGPASDIYSLGGTLYDILTGKRSLDIKPNDDRERLRELTIKGEFPPPRQRNPTVPPPLEAICLKAMSLKPEDRYVTARSLADDIESWLADEPVTAYAEPWTIRAARWARRHRAWVQAGTVALILVSVVSMLSAVLINQSLSREVRATEKSEKLRKIATAEVEDWARLKDVLKYYPTVWKARNDMLHRAERDYAKLAKAPEATREDKHTHATLLVRLADWQGPRTEAIQSYQSAVDELEALVQASNERDTISLEYAEALGTLGVLKADPKLVDRALRALDWPPPLPLQMRHLALQCDLKALQGMFQDEVAARKTVSEIRSALEAFAAVPENKDSLNAETSSRPLVDQTNLAMCYLRLAELAESIPDHKTADEALIIGISRFQSLLNLNPDNPEVVEGLAKCQERHANRLRAKGLDEEEIKQRLATIKQLSGLRKRRPDVISHTELLASANLNLAQKLNQQGKNWKSLVHADESWRSFLEISLLRRNAGLAEEYADSMLQLAASEVLLGRLHRDIGNSVLAEYHFQSALKLFEDLIRGDPSVRERRATCRSQYGRLLHQLGRHSEAATEFEDALNEYRALQATTVVQDAIAACLTYYGDLLRATHAREAEAKYAEAAGLRRILASRESTTPLQILKRAEFLTTCREIKFRNYPLAVAEARRAADLGNRNHRYLLILGAALLRNGQPGAALDHLLQAIPELERQQLAQPNGELDKVTDPRPFYYLALAYQAAGLFDVAAYFHELALEVHLREAPGDLDLAALRDEVESYLW